MYYSFVDDQTGDLMHMGRNSKTLEELYTSKLDYHSDLEEDISKMYDLDTIQGQIVCCFDFEFHLIKHTEKLPEDDFDSYTKNWGEIDKIDMTEHEALEEFKTEIVV